MKHNFKYLKKEADAVCDGNPMSPESLEFIMDKYQGGCEELKDEIVAFLEVFGETCKRVASINYGVDFNRVNIEEQNNE